MARPTKQGVDYFPLDIHLDDKFKFIQIKYGLEGFAVVIKILQKIYSYGYWYQWGEDESLIFAHENSIGLDKLDLIIEETIKRGIFHEGIYKHYQVLTSSGIQKRYKEIVKRRKDVEVVEEYLLVDNNFGVNANIVPTQCKHSDDKSTQSKVEESRVEKSKEEGEERILEKQTPTKKIYGEFSKVKLLEEEYNKLLEKLGKDISDDLIVRLDSYKASTGKTYKSDYATILNWSRKEGAGSGGNKSGTNSYDTKNEKSSIAERAGVTSL